MAVSSPISTMIISDVLEHWPETAAVFHAHDMACVGCVVAPFYTIHDAAIVYGLSPEAFVAELAAVVEGIQDEPDRRQELHANRKSE